MKPVPNHAVLSHKQISLTEWLEGIGHKNTAALRQEDIHKYHRLEILRQVMGLPYGQPHQFPATAVAAHDSKFETYIRDHATELCMIRLAPKDPAEPKYRMRGQTIAQAVEWFKQQPIDPRRYDIYFVPHSEDYDWSTIFVINEHGIFGEMIKGLHNLLTQGLYQKRQRPTTFRSDFTTWQLDPVNSEAETYLRRLTSRLKVTAPSIRSQLTIQLQASFSHDLCGYFETTRSPTLGTWFLDYSRTLGEMYQSFSQTAHRETAALVTGQTGSPGRATGHVRIVSGPPETARLEPGEILVCRMTTPDYLPLMQGSCAIVTDLGGILSHAAIVARELGKPCLTATGQATAVLKTGQLVEVDADAGVVRAAQSWRPA